MELHHFLEISVFDHLVSVKKDPVSAFKLACALGKNGVKKFTTDMIPDWINVGDYGIVRKWDGNQLISKFVHQVVKITVNGIHVKRCKINRDAGQYNKPLEPVEVEGKTTKLFKPIMGVKFDRSQKLLTHIVRNGGGHETIQIFKNFKTACLHLADTRKSQKSQ